MDYVIRLFVVADAVQRDHHQLPRLGYVSLLAKSNISTQLTLYFSCELNIGIVAACMPMLKPLLDRMFPRLFAATPGPRHINLDTALRLESREENVSANHLLASDDVNSRSITRTVEISQVSTIAAHEDSPPSLEPISYYKPVPQR